MKFSHDVSVGAPLTSIDLGEWIFAMTDDEYRACARGHHAMGVIGGSKRLGLINVEAMAGSLMVQHYRTEALQADHVAFVSNASEGYLLRTLPFKMAVTWDMQVSATSETTSILRCAIGYEAPLWVRTAGVFNRANDAVRRHLIEETEGFARDIATKVSGTARMGETSAHTH